MYLNYDHECTFKFKHLQSQIIRNSRYLLQWKARGANQIFKYFSLVHPSRNKDYQRTFAGSKEC